MKLQRLLKSWVATGLVLLSLAFYKTTAPEPIPAAPKKQCCRGIKDCPAAKPSNSNAGRSIIWDSMAENLLSARL